MLIPAGRPDARLARDAARAAVAQQQTRAHHPDFTQTRGWKAVQAEKLLPKDGLNAEIARGLELGLPGASSVEDRTIPTFSRGELPHFAGINTFMVSWRSASSLSAVAARCQQLTGTRDAWARGWTNANRATPLDLTRRKHHTWRTRGW
eukprot:COSAG02_NODE_705_length_18261_cov_45.441716_6_plen_149_part_00